MRPFLLSISIILLALAGPQRIFAQSADSGESADSSELFLNAYMANEQGEKLENSGDSHKALEKYRYAASLLEEISRDDPKWQPIVVDYRKKRVSQNIAHLEQQLGAQPVSPEAAAVHSRGNSRGKRRPPPRT